MATAIILLMVTLSIGLLVFRRSPPKGSQEDKLKKDGTYSTHNYKQPNKAAVARQWEAPSGVAVSPIDATQLPADNYKQHAGQATGSVSGPAPTPAPITDRHYKTQHWLQAEPKTVDPLKKKPANGQPITDE